MMCENFWRIKKTAFCLFGWVLAALPSQASELQEADFGSLPRSDLYIIGEVHDNAAHHQRQALAVASLQPKAIVFEMLSLEQAQQAVAVDRTDPRVLSEALGWTEDGWGKFQSRHATFTAAPDAQIYGASVPVADLRVAMTDGAATAFGPDAEGFGLTSQLPEDQQLAREELQEQAHCNALPAEMIPGMVEAQRLRDAAFARVALEALKETGGPVVVITGNGHARDWGIPHALMVAAPDIRVISIGQLSPDEVERPYDYWMISPAVERGDDPCDRFKSK